MTAALDKIKRALKKASRKMKAGKAGPHSRKGYKRHKKHKEKINADKE